MSPCWEGLPSALSESSGRNCINQRAPSLSAGMAEAVCVGLLEGWKGLRRFSSFNSPGKLMTGRMRYSGFGESKAMSAAQLSVGGIPTSRSASCLSDHTYSPGLQRGRAFCGAGWSESVHHLSPVVSISGGLGLSSSPSCFSTCMLLLLLLVQRYSSFLTK